MAKTEFLWEQRVSSDIRRIALVGYGSIAVLAGGFGYWAMSAPLSGATVAQGVIAAAGNNILIQHLEGGIIRDVLVQEGDRIEPGQDLIALDPTAAQTNLNRLARQSISLKVRALRLEAERDGLETLDLAPLGTTALLAADADDLMREQQKEFQARLNRFRSERLILQQRVSTLRETLAGLASQKAAIQRQLAVVGEEIRVKKGLLDKGLANRSEYSQLLRSEAGLVGQGGAIEAQLAAANTQIIEAREQIEHLATERVEQAVITLNEVRGSLADVKEQMLAAEAVLRRTTIKAPVAGIVLSSIYNSEGSVIAPGEKIMEILPTGSGLVVEARLHPRDIDLVHLGQSAKLRLPALNMRLTPDIAGTVTHVSADRLTDEATREPYFRTRLKPAGELPAEMTEAQLYPGMPVEVFINTGDRTFVEYLARPVLDSFTRAFTEQ